MLRKIIILMVLLLPRIVLSQQLSLDFFSDTSRSEFDYIYNHIKVEDGIIISGKIGNEPGVIKISPTGELMWSTWESVLLGTLNCSGFTLDLFEDGYIYGTSYNENSKTLWKINATNGIVAWNKLFYSDQYFANVKTVDYDSSTFYVSTRHTADTNIVVKIDKFSGDTIKSRSFIPEIENEYLLAVDDNKNVYYTDGMEVIKFNRDNFDLPLWKNNLFVNEPYGFNNIEDIYLDQYDEIYLFLLSLDNDNHVAKLDLSTGKIIWVTDPLFSDTFKRDFIDQDEKLYITYRHQLFGGGSYHIRTAKLHKRTGYVYWTTNEDFETGNDEEQSAMSMDIDCEGNIYSTGYYDDVNYGPDEWGIIKLNGENGSKINSTHIDYDPFYDDNLSIGLVTCVFNNQPFFLGHREEVPGEIEPLLVMTNPDSGNVIHESYLGSSYRLQSKTISIQREVDSVYILKQFGEKITLEKYDQNMTLIWSNEISNGELILGCNLGINTENLYLSAIKPKESNTAPYYSDSTEFLYIYNLNKFDGTIESFDSLNTSGNITKGIELESDAGNVFIFYTQNDSINMVKWDGITFSSILYIDSIGTHSANPGGTNLVANYNSTSLIYCGNNELIKIDKELVTSESLINYDHQLNPIDNLLISDTLIISGDDNSNSQRLEIINIAEPSIISSNLYDELGSLNQIEFNSNMNSIFVSGTINGHPTIHNLNYSTGDENWMNYIDSASFHNALPLTIVYNEHKEYVAIGGLNYTTTTGSDAMLLLYDVIGHSQYSELNLDEHHLSSMICASKILPNQNILVGGSYNNFDNPKAGFLGTYDYGVSETNLFMTACDSLISSNGSLYISTGQYKDTLTNIYGCDSIINLDLTIFPSFNDTIYVEAIDTYISPSGKATYNMSGIYTDTLVTSHECDSILTINLSISLSESSSSYLIGPNPTSGEAYLIGDFMEKDEILIFDVSGRQVLKFALGINSSFNISYLAAGKYFYRVVRKEKIITNGKFVKI